jgi:hypothetical protein
MKGKATILLVLLLLIGAPAAAEQKIVFREDFRDLTNWEPLYFPKIKQHSTYHTITEGNKTVLRTQSRASASGIVLRKAFNPYKTPRLRWRWKVDNVYGKSDGRLKAGDDYPIRIYVMFPYDPERAGLSDRVLYGAMKTLYGQYPPHSTLNYVWASSPQAGDVIISPYTDRARMVVLERGPARVGQWVEESVNIIADYRKAFGRAPPQTAGLAIMNDSDNTGEGAVSYVEFIELSD